jgi:D-cysteine desulfhydrase
MVTDPVQLSEKIRAALAPCSLGRWPTSLEAAPGAAAALGLAHLWLKREDLSAAICGGVKVRGLEFLLAGARPDTVFVTIGGTGSTHCLATAVHARALGYRSALALFPQPDTDTARAVAVASAAAADIVVRAGSLFTFPLAVLSAWRAAGRLGRPRWIPGGGAHPRGVVGHCLAGLELASQLLPALPPPDALLVPLGSGGTAAGLLLAVGLLGWPTTVVAVRVAPRLVANGWRVRSLALGAAALLRPLGVSPHLPLPALRLVDGLGPGYGHPSAPGESARRFAVAHGLALDPTYGAKAFAELRPLAASGFRRVVFWHTFAAPPPPPLP